MRLVESGGARVTCETCSGLLQTELQLRQPSVQAATASKFVMRAAGDDPAVVEHDDAIGLAHRGEAVGDGIELPGAAPGIVEAQAIGGTAYSCRYPGCGGWPVLSLEREMSVSNGWVGSGHISQPVDRFE